MNFSKKIQIKFINLLNMKLFKTERIIYFNTKYSQTFKPNEIISKPEQISTNEFISINENYPRKFLTKKVGRFRVDKYSSFLENQKKIQKEGRWTLKEHIQFLQALEKFGQNWKKISDFIPSRTSTQIRSHSQKFFKRLKECKDIELGIDFTSRHINNVNDMIAHIKSVNKDYNIVNVFLYLSEKCYPNKNSQKENKENKANININNIIDETININNNNSNNYLFTNDIKENIIDKGNNINKQIINNNFINTPINNIYINNVNYLNCSNNLDPLILLNLNNSISLNNINNGILLQNVNTNNYDIMNECYINNINNINNNYKKAINNFEFSGNNF